jgi:hypothetical protein
MMQKAAAAHTAALQGDHEKATAHTDPSQKDRWFNKTGPKPIGKHDEF